ncbi:Bug family tripartite tricarboxylate transporter substrate binding protein [Alcaligenes sp. SDU_A2]|uniref:Bug family tripartite tricarboxylate transporter substrate binding protein n=1 Tax=Alcaligenes sp. SDU_A2 TaxID=3136634 RepID=UPI002C3AAB08|nr:Bug family tripartite tricarboxylate transporter substrate binding protein [Alcaligenes faecalis]
MKRKWTQVAVGAALALAAGMAGAAKLPDTVRLVVGYPAGGTADAVARVYAEELREKLGVNVVVDNRAGAGGQVAAQGFLRSPVDGSVLLVANNHMMTTLPLTVKTVTYDPVKDFQPVAVIAKFEHIFVVGKTTPANTLAEYVELVRKEPEKYGHYGIPAPGSAPQFLGYSIAKKNDIQMTPVPYKGGAPLINDLLGDHIPAGVDAVGLITEHVAAGTVRVLGITGPKRLDILKDVPTFVEMGYGNLEASGWMGIFAPVGMDPAMVKQFQDAFNEVAKNPKIEKAIVPIGFRPSSGDGQELARTVQADLDTWGPIIKESGYLQQ